MKKIVFTISIILSLALCSCNKEGKVQELSLLFNSYSFSGYEDSVTVYVKSSTPDWKAESTADWIQLGERGEDSIVVKVLPNEGELRTGSVKFTTGFAETEFKVEQMKQQFTGQFGYMQDFEKAIISPNGNYAMGVYQNVLTEGGLDYWEFIPVVYNTATGETIEYKPLKFESVAAKAISDDGKMMFFEVDGFSSVVMDTESNVATVMAPSGYKAAVVEGISSDATIWVGYAWDPENFYYVPVKWINGEPIIMEMPETNSGNMPLSNGAMARGCSPDGSVIFGSEWDSYGLIYWKNDVMHYPGQDLAEVNEYLVKLGDGTTYTEKCVSCIIKTAEPYSISNNGKWLSATYWDRVQLEPMEAPVIKGYPVRVNLESGQIEIFKELEDYGATTVNNDGEMFGCYPFKAGTSYYAFDLENKTAEPFSTWMSATYGLQVGETYTVRAFTQNALFGTKMVVNAFGPTYKFWYYNTSVK